MSIIVEISELINVDKKIATNIFEKAVAGGEINNNVNDEMWFEKRFKPNVVFIDDDGYSKMCIDALKILGSTAATDYGGSRQRDLGQMWADMTRGYLGEYAFKLFLKNKFNINANLGHEVGNIADFLPHDIHEIVDNNGNIRAPRLNVSIKTSKWNGIWLDIPGEQFQHSDVQVFVKVGTGRDHLFAFFKKISVFKDKVLKKGTSVGAISEDESENIYNSLPNFSIIPAYICGFVKKDKKYSNLSYEGKKGRKNYTITGWNGKINTGDLELIKQNEIIVGSVKFEGIGEFAHDNGYLFNTGNLLWKDRDWQFIVENL